MRTYSTGTLVVLGDNDMHVTDAIEPLFVVVEVWRGMASNAHLFRDRSSADNCAEQLRQSTDLIENDVEVIETQLR